jgi:hypothetical protein
MGSESNVAGVAPNNSQKFRVRIHLVQNPPNVLKTFCVIRSSLTSHAVKIDFSALVATFLANCSQDRLTFVAVFWPVLWIDFAVFELTVNDRNSFKM